MMNKINLKFQDTKNTVLGFIPEPIKALNMFDVLPKPAIRSIIIHIHGGGFVSMSSGSHQSYTRKLILITDL